ncbi:MAG: VTT domain-containing protein [Desulfobacula sp.]|jgi:uncharacterized membrane protein YdjX (TVP38/TMEM64 family)|nr:VTT domain-containing protein [Desulfobacula sp.]
MKTDLSKFIIAGVLIAVIVLFFVFDMKQYFALEYIKAQQDALNVYYQNNTLLTIAVYMLIYSVVTALSLPGAAVMTLVGGGLFGLLVGTVVVSFASTIGATLAFIVSRLLLRDWVQTKFGDKLQAINDGIEADGAFYLFTLRLVPAFPFFIINLVMGLTPIKTIQFYLASQIGMLAGTIVYVNAGTQLSKIDSLKGILSPGLLISFILLGIFPILAKKGLKIIKRKKG